MAIATGNLVQIWLEQILHGLGHLHWIQLMKRSTSETGGYMFKA
jgi:hypothetical protein